MLDSPRRCIHNLLRMNPSQHFLISFASSILVATLAAGGVYLAQDHLNKYSIPPYIVMLVVFIVFHLLVRWIFSNFVPVRCPRGCGKKAHPIPGRADRFRCHSCGQDF